MVKTSIIYTYEYRSYKGEQPKWLNLMFTVNISQQTIAMHYKSYYDFEQTTERISLIQQFCSMI